MEKSEIIELLIQVEDVVDQLNLMSEEPLLPEPEREEFAEMGVYGLLYLTFLKKLSRDDPQRARSALHDTRQEIENYIKLGKKFLSQPVTHNT